MFAKGYCGKMNCVRAAKELPTLSDEEVVARARPAWQVMRRLGFMGRSRGLLGRRKDMLRKRRWCEGEDVEDRVEL